MIISNNDTITQLIAIIEILKKVSGGQDQRRQKIMKVLMKTLKRVKLERARRKLARARNFAKVKAKKAKMEQFLNQKVRLPMVKSFSLTLSFDITF